MDWVIQNWLWLLVALLALILNIVSLIKTQHVGEQVSKIEQDVAQLIGEVKALSSEVKALTFQVNKLTIEKSQTQQNGSIENMISKPYDRPIDTFVDIEGFIVITLEDILNCSKGG